MAKPEPLDQDWLRALVQVIVRHYKPLRIVLFGSYARGDYNAASDLDLFMLVGEAADWFERGIEFKRLVREERLPIEAHIYTAHEYARMKAVENPLLLQIESEGRVVYQHQRT